MNFSESIKQKRKDKGLTQEELADILFVSRQTVSNWENGKTLPDIDSLILLSEALDVSIDELVKGDNGLKDSIVIRSNLEKKIEDIQEYLGYALLLIAVFFFDFNFYAVMAALLLITFSDDIAKTIVSYFFNNR